MKTIHLTTIAALIIGSASMISTAHAEQKVSRTDLVQKDIDIPGHEVVQVRVDFPPGVLAPSHSHPGEEIAYVVSGTLEYVLAGQKPIVLEAGQSLFIPSGVAHSARNVGNQKASELATYIVRKGEKLVVPR